MEPEKVIELSDILARAEYRVHDTTAFVQHAYHGTLEEFYKQFLMDAVIDIAILPIDRQHEGLPAELLEAATDITPVLQTIINMAADAFHKSAKAVERDLLEIMKQFPTADVRESTELRYKGMLH